MTDRDLYEVYAVKYAEHSGRPLSDQFMGGDPHDRSGQLDFFVWVITNGKRTYVVDTGFNHEAATARNRKLTRLPVEGLALCGIDAKTVKDVIITHLHFDHAGTLADFPNAKFHIQDEEVGYATGRHMCHAVMRHAYNVEDVCTLVRKVYKDEVVFHEGDETIAPGISVHHIGGHAKGLMSVRVETKRGPVVLASDASHLYANMEQKKPFPILYNLGGMMEGWNKLYRLAEAPSRVVPGHDPLVTRRYPALSKDLEGIVVRLDAEPRD
jgi:glyoxylase-like metal-dependent hydrolase (beta-lactamase superfamily II)